MATQYAFGKIVTNGLVLALDAADKNSYPGSGTTWRDIASNNNASINNGPTFSSTNGGYFTFDGVDDNVSIPYNSNFNTSIWTLSSWFRLNLEPDTGYNTIVARSYYDTNINYYIDCGDANKKFRAGSYKFSPETRYEVTSSTTVTSTVGKWTNITAYRTSDYKVGMYINGIKETEVTFGSVDFSSTNVNSDITVGAFRNNLGVISRVLIIGSVANTQLYNRALSDQEILQNYNAQKSRFNL